MKVEDVNLGVPDSKIDKVMAVIAITTKDGRALGVGIHKRDSTNWTKSDTFGETNSFEKIITTADRHSDWDIDFEGDLDGSDNWAYICSVDSEGSADASRNYPAFYYANTYGQTYNLSDTDYENGWYLPALNEMFEIAHLNREVVQNSLSKVDGFHFDTGYYLTSSQHPNNPLGVWDVGIDRDVIGIFAKHCTSCSSVYLRSFSEKSFYRYTKDFSFPLIDRVEVSTAGEGYTGQLNVTIFGKNLKGNKITSDDSSFSNLKYFSDSMASATINCDGLVGSKILTVTCGNSSAECLAKVVSSKKCFSVGDVLFTDGSRVKVSDVQGSISNKDSARIFGVVASVIYGGGTVKVIGLQKSSEELEWTTRETLGFENSLPEIRSDYNGLKTTSFTFEGDLDGSDNWSYLCRVDSEGTLDAQTNYPAFDFANSYGKIAGLVGTDYEKGWYIPSVKELHDVYLNKDVVQNSLDAVGGFTLVPNGTQYVFDYWSSSSSSSATKNVSYVNFVDGYVGYTNKSYSNHVLVMQSVEVKGV